MMFRVLGLQLPACGWDALASTPYVPAALVPAVLVPDGASTERTLTVRLDPSLKPRLRNAREIPCGRALKVGCTTICPGPSGATISLAGTFTSQLPGIT